MYICDPSIAQSNEEQMRRQRLGTFKKGHKKLGGRKKGTPNRFNRDLLQATVQAAEQVGADGKGKGGVDGYLQRLAGKKEGYFVSLLRQAVQKQVPTAEPENEVMYATEQDYRQALLDRGVHPTLLPPPPRDPHEKPPAHLTPPKPPPGWGWLLRKTNEPAELDKERLDLAAQSDHDAEESVEVDKEQPGPTKHPKENGRSREIQEPEEPPYGTPWNPAPGQRWEYNSYTKSWFAHPK
jgi:hypothetical protein